MCRASGRGGRVPGASGDDAARLVAVLNAPNTNLRTEALRLLGRLSDVATLPAVAAQTQEGEPLPVRLAAVAALGRLRHPDAVPVLVRLLSAREPACGCRRSAPGRDWRGARRCRAAAAAARPGCGRGGKVVAALSRTKAPSAVTPLLAALQHPDWRVRAAVAHSLDAWEDARIPPALARRWKTLPRSCGSRPPIAAETGRCARDAAAGSPRPEPPRGGMALTLRCRNWRPNPYG
ncbi:HEAT repeat domain-containing protein [Chloracidobacterium aggregatum]|uniref:HEAT repeat domain-containing protein n=1 Tax=Chloracidobacterium aggregatum TaxID=2851959 RepID=UPI00387EBC7F